MGAWNKEEPDSPSGLCGIGRLHRGPGTTEEPDSIDMLCGYKVRSFSKNQGFGHAEAYCELVASDGRVVDYLMYQDYEGPAEMTHACLALIREDGGDI